MVSNDIFFFSKQEHTSHVKDILKKISNILISQNNRENKIRKIYSLIEGIDNAKGIYYNFNTEEYLKWVRKNEKR